MLISGVITLIISMTKSAPSGNDGGGGDDIIRNSIPEVFVCQRNLE